MRTALIGLAFGAAFIGFAALLAALATLGGHSASDARIEADERAQEQWEEARAALARAAQGGRR